MVFSYYKRLTASQKQVYDRSDRISTLRVPRVSELHTMVNALKESLVKEDRKQAEALSQELVAELIVRLRAPRIRVRVLAVRPRNARGELYGIYYPSDKGIPAMITVWMRTAQQKRVVAFKTFLRTLLHELCHHLDYEYFEFPYSFHTEGFYKRESSLFHQLTGE